MHRLEPLRKILIVDHNAWLAEFCAGVVRDLSPSVCTVVTATADAALGDSAQDWFRILVNPTTPGTAGLSLVRAFARLGVADRTCILTADVDRAILSEARALGVLGYLHTSMPVNGFIDGLRRVMCGTRVLPDVQGGESAPRLSGRQLAVLRLLQAGMSSKQIAHELYIAEGTAKNHTLTLLRSLGATNRAHAVARAIELGLLSSREKKR